MQLLDNVIRKVAVIDDKAAACEAMAEAVEDANLEPVTYQDRLESIRNFIPRVIKETDAAIFDHYLKPGNYANFNGAEAVFRLYKKKISCTIGHNIFKSRYR
jgi:hypothetical protein